MRGRRFLILVAVLMGFTALAASLAPRQPLPRDQRAAEATPTPAPPARGSDRPVQRRISTLERPRRVAVDQGTLLELTVDGDELDSVTLLDEVAIVTPETDAIFDIYADTPGEYPIELVEADREVGTLVVRD